MDRPNPQDYNEAIQNPSICFADRDLQTAQVEVGPIGLPRPATGAFASVYKLIGSSNGATAKASDVSQRRIWAVRCFHSDVPDHKIRYRHIIETLTKIRPQ